VEKKTISLITIFSILSILVVISYVMFTLTNLPSDTWTEEIPPLSINLLVLMPALLGLIRGENWQKSKMITIGFVIYGLLTIAGYVNVFISKDALAAGFPMLMVIIPFAILFSIYLVVQIKRN